MKRKFNFIFFILSFILILTSYKNNNYTETEYSYKLNDNVTDIEITSGDEFSIVETSRDEKAMTPLNYSIIDNKLVLNYNDSNNIFKFIFFSTIFSKINLTFNTVKHYLKKNYLLYTL